MTIPGQPVWHLGLLRVEEDIIPHGARSNFGKNMPKSSQNRNIPGNSGTHWTLALIARKLIWEPLKQSKSARRLLHITWMVTQQFLGTGNRRSLILKIGTSSVNVIFVFSHIYTWGSNFQVCLQPDNDQIKKLRDEWNQVEEKSNYYAMMKLKEQAGGGLARHKRLCFPVMVPLVPGPVPSQLPIIRADTLTLSWNLTNHFFPSTTLLWISMLTLSMWVCKLVGLTFRRKECRSWRNICMWI